MNLSQEKAIEALDMRIKDLMNQIESKQKEFRVIENSTKSEIDKINKKIKDTQKEFKNKIHEKNEVQQKINTLQKTCVYCNQQDDGVICSKRPHYPFLLRSWIIYKHWFEDYDPGFFYKN